MSLSLIRCSMAFWSRVLSGHVSSLMIHQYKTPRTLNCEQWSLFEAANYDLLIHLRTKAFLLQPGGWAFRMAPRKESLSAICEQQTFASCPLSTCWPVVGLSLALLAWHLNCSLSPWYKVQCHANIVSLLCFKSNTWECQFDMEAIGMSEKKVPWSWISCKNGTRRE